MGGWWPWAWHARRFTTGWTDGDGLHRSKAGTAKQWSPRARRPRCAGCRDEEQLEGTWARVHSGFAARDPTSSPDRRPCSLP